MLLFRRQHHCYSTAKKNGWESYTVEKGCKKIIYCRAHRESMPALWTLPWNFCCDRSRCNAKLGEARARVRPTTDLISLLLAIAKESDFLIRMLHNDCY